MLMQSYAHSRSCPLKSLLHDTSLAHRRSTPFQRCLAPESALAHPPLLHLGLRWRIGLVSKRRGIYSGRNVSSASQDEVIEYVLLHLRHPTVCLCTESELDLHQRLE